MRVNWPSIVARTSNNQQRLPPVEGSKQVDMRPARRAAQEALARLTEPTRSRKQVGWTSSCDGSAADSVESDASAGGAASSDESLSEQEAHNVRAKKRRKVDVKKVNAAHDEREIPELAARTERLEGCTSHGDKAYCAASMSERTLEPQHARHLPRAHPASYHTSLLLSQAPLPSLADHRDGSRMFEQATLGERAREALLEWYEGVSASRKMPWRKAFVEPHLYAGREAVLRETLKRRAYEVWISEIMLQQTRVETVIPYYNRWLSTWPTIESLAEASSEEVLSLWKGLGYYSRAIRLQKGAKTVVAHAKHRGLLPSSTDELCKIVPGVGPYTAGAISCIVFGNAAPMMDGNAYRVFARQLGLYADMNSKKVLGCLEQQATACVQAVAARDAEGHVLPSKRCGDWGQAIMELGATLCTPLKPDCQACPIRSTCRAYAEGTALASRAGHSPHTLRNVDVGTFGPDFSDVSFSRKQDIEDLCTMCERMEEEADLGTGTRSPRLPEKSSCTVMQAVGSRVRATGRKVQSTLNFGQARHDALQTTGEDSKRIAPKVDDAAAVREAPSPEALEVIRAHVQRFPRKVIKKAPREEACVVLIVRSDKGEVLIEQRAHKGLLAGLWQFPARSLQCHFSSAVNTAEKRKQEASTKRRQKRAGQGAMSRGQESGMGADDAQAKAEAGRLACALLPEHVGTQCNGLISRGKLVHLFSHIKLHMHVFELDLVGSTRAFKSDPLRVDAMQVGARETTASTSSAGPSPRREWVVIEDLPQWSLSTGNIRCWEMCSFVPVATATSLKRPKKR